MMALVFRVAGSVKLSNIRVYSKIIHVMLKVGVRSLDLALLIWSLSVLFFSPHPRLRQAEQLI